MICTNRIYKGETFEVSIPFRVEGWSNLYVEYFTDGQYKVTRTAEELEIDEYTITAGFSGSDLDLLADGVLRYTLYYTLEGVAYTKSTNTPYYLKTPAGYSGVTADEIFQSGYTAGQEDCECSGSSCNIQTKLFIVTNHNMENVFPDEGYDGMNQVMLFTSGLWNSAYTEGYNQGIAACGSELYEGAWCTDENWDGEAVTLTPLTHFASTAAGFSAVTITDCGYGQKKYNEGYKKATEYYKSNRRQYAYSGSVTFNRDYTYNDNYGNDKFGIFVYGEDFSGNNITKFVSRGYQAVDGEVIKDGDSWSAGTYGYVGMFEEETMRTNPEMKKGWVEPPIFFNQNDGSFNVRLVFIQ